MLEIFAFQGLIIGKMLERKGFRKGKDAGKVRGLERQGLWKGKGFGKVRMLDREGFGNVRILEM